MFGLRHKTFGSLGHKPSQEGRKLLTVPGQVVGFTPLFDVLNKDY